MQRPLVWVGVAYMAGGLWRILGQPLYTGLMAAAIVMVITGRYRRQLLKSRMFYILPVFFVSAFVNYSRAMAYPCEDILSGQTAEAAFCGTVISCEEKENSAAVVIKSAAIEIRDFDSKEERRAGLLIYLSKEDELPRTGYVICGTGQLEKPERASNPGQFDAAGYYHARGIDYILWPEQMEIVSRSFSYQILLQRIREYWIEIYRQCLTERDAGIMGAILLGDKAMLDEDIQDLYQKVGIVHILAISGLHISMIGMGVFGLFRRLGAGFRLSSCAAAFLVLSYGVMTGYGPSTERAVIMFLVKMGAVFLGRSYDMLSALSLAALIIFIRQPLMMTQAGVQFSFAAVLSIGILWPAMRRVIIGEQSYKTGEKGGTEHYWERLAEYLGPSAAVTIGTLPLAAFYYGEIPLMSFFLNLVALPLMEILVPVGLVMGMAGFVLPSVSRFLGGSIHFMLIFNNGLCELTSRVPMAVWRTGTPPTVLVVFYYMILITFIVLELSTDGRSSEYRKKLLMLLMVCGIILIPFRRMIPLAAFLDVGQGDCIFVRTTSGTTWLVDGGSSDVRNVGQYRIIPFLNYYGEGGVDYACVTHGDEDHLSGIRELLAENMISHLVLTRASETDPVCMELADMASVNGIETIYIEAGDYWKSGEWEFECIYPDSAETFSADKNDSSMVLKLQAGKKVFLLTGDISEKAESKLEGGKLEDTDVLKVAHHGSGSSSSGEFLEKTGAELAIISCGANNRYGHPAEETIKRLENAGMDILITMETGAILMPYRDGRFEVRTYLEE
ncbi:MAG: DNA internalization-related competence protein ComEC/Rec2 [Coprococcus sp.]